MIRVAAALALSMWLSTSAEAACPWAGAQSLRVSATMTQVWVNDVPYQVRGFTARTRFQRTLVECGAPDAARAFESWRSHRRYTNILFGLGWLLWPAWIGAPVTAIMAGDFKWQMIDALHASRPPALTDGLVGTGGVTTPPPTSTEGKSHFREARWGMTTAQVRASETASFHSEDGDRLFFEDQVAGLNIMLMYQFAEGRLAMGKYVSVEEHSNPDDHITDYHRLFKALASKYGQPTENEEVWRKDTRKQTPEAWGEAVAQGELVYYAQWETAETEIVLALVGDGGDVTLAIEYHGKAFEDLADQSREKGMLDGL